MLARSVYVYSLSSILLSLNSIYLSSAYLFVNLSNLSLSLPIQEVYLWPALIDVCVQHLKYIRDMREDKYIYIYDICSK